MRTCSVLGIRFIHADPMIVYIPIDIIDLIYVFDDHNIRPRKIQRRGSAVFGRQISRSSYARSEEGTNIFRSADHDPLDTPGTQTSSRPSPSPVFFIEPAPSFTRSLEKLRSKPGRPAEAAAKADRVLEALASGRAAGLREAKSLTTWGESRVTGCAKFNLGCGYRLIFSRRGGTIVPHFLGNHEDCHRWLMANRGLDLRPDRRMTSAAREVPPDEEDTHQEFEPSPDLAVITLSDRELRQVFAGLCGVANSVPQQSER